MKAQRSILISALAIAMVLGITLSSARALEFGDWEDTWHKAKFKIKATCYATFFLDFFKASSKENAWIYIDSYNAPDEFSAFLVTLDEDGITWQANPMTLEILYGTASQAMLELTDPITITDEGIGGKVGLLSFFAMLTGKEKNAVFKSGAIKSICGTATIEVIGQAECFGPMTFSCKKTNEEKVPQKVIDAKDNASDPPPPSVEAEIINPGFEDGSTGWSMGKTAGTTCSFTIDSDAYEGSNAAKLTVTNDGYCMLRNSTPIEITQTGTYRFNSRAKVSGDIHHLTIAIWKSDDQATPPNTPVDSMNPNFSGNYDLNQLTVVLSAGDYIRLELGIDNNASGISSVLFDSLVLGID